MDDRSDRQIVYRDRQYTKGYRACGGYGTAEVLLMGLVWLGAEAAAVLLVLPRIGLIDYRRSRVTVEIDESSLRRCRQGLRLGSIFGVKSVLK